MELQAPQPISCSCSLRPLNPRHKQIEVTLCSKDRFRFGRRLDLEQSFPSDFRISSIHATLLVDGGMIAVEDSSVNGTFVNGERVARNTRRALKSGDHMYLVIPDQALLQTGYMGSLTVNFVGYIFNYVPGTSPTFFQPIAPDMAPAPTESAKTPPEEPIRQTTDARELINAVSGQEQQQQQESEQPRLKDRQSHRQEEGLHAMEVVDTKPEGHLRGSNSLEQKEAAESPEHVSFAAWWLANIAGDGEDS